MSAICWQRRYVESLSAYARQFLGRMKKPDCRSVKGIPPAIAIEQKNGNRNSRSTVGTASEVYDYLRMLFARIGRTYSPVSGREVKRHSVEDVIRFMKSCEEGTRFTVLAPLSPAEKRPLDEVLRLQLQQGIVRIDLDGEMVDIEEWL